MHGSPLELGAKQVMITLSHTYCILSGEAVTTNFTFWCHSNSGPTLIPAKRACYPAITEAVFLDKDFIMKSTSCFFMCCYFINCEQKQITTLLFESMPHKGVEIIFSFPSLFTCADAMRNIPHCLAPMYHVFDHSDQQ